MRGESKRGAKRPRDVNMDVIWGLGLEVAVRCRSPAPGRERFKIGVELGIPGELAAFALSHTGHLVSHLSLVSET